MGRMTGDGRGALAAGLAAALLAGCASNKNLVVVVPEANGHVGAVVVHSGASAAVLDRAYAAAAPTPSAAHPLKAGAEDKAKVDAAFGDTLAALPAPPLSQPLYFTEGVTLTPESEAALRALLVTLKGRKAVEVVITGYTDTVGTDDYNDRLSQDRAETVKQALTPILTEYGVAADSVTAVGRGKRELAVPTADNVVEPRNRRVEVTVR
jgi:outer membrane protein OmpA-like peptidoglycan-associated protein